MPLVSMRQLLDEAAKGGYGVGAFNVNDMEQIQAIHGSGEGNQFAGSSSRPAAVRASLRRTATLFHLILAASELHPEIPIAMHQDHGNQLRDL